MECCVRKNGIIAVVDMPPRTADQLQRLGFIDEWQEFNEEDFINGITEIRQNETEKEL